MKELSDKRKACVKEYCRNGHNWVQAMITAGYSETYANHQGYKVLDNVGVKALILAADKDIEAKSDYDVITWLQDTRSDRARAIKHGNDSAVAAFGRLLAQYTGALEADNRQRQTQLGIAIKAERVAIDALLVKALDETPDAIVE